MSQTPLAHSIVVPDDQPRSDSAALDPELRRVLSVLARTPSLLVACDYDGTLSPIVTDPSRAAPVPESVTALRKLAELPSTEAAVISGRALRDLAVLSRLPAEVSLVGSHGSEFDAGFVTGLGPEERRTRQEILDTVAELAEAYPGVLIEAKPASVAIHVRNAERAEAETVLRLVAEGPARWPNVQVTHGKEVVELSVVHTDKGTALDTLRHRYGATAVVFFGDDVTDENAFARLSGPDVGIKVGSGESAAAYRVGAPQDVARLLAHLLDARRQWMFGERAVPIERLTMLANRRTVALLTPEARLTWLCHPRPDSAALFADLLGGPPAGHFSVTPSPGAALLGQRYVDRTMTVETRYAGITVVDYLAHDTDPGRNDLVRVISGRGGVRLEFAPRPEFGQMPVRIQRQPGGLRVFGTNEPVVLKSPGVRWELTTDGQHTNAVAEVTLTGEPLVLELRCGTPELDEHPVPEPRRRARAEEFWREWLGGLRVSDVKPDRVARSALTLKALCHEDTGAIIAAATTSLPEALGGIRNWDYRYCWLRDAAMTASALVSLGSLTEAEGFLAWLHDVVDRAAGPEWVHPLYTVDGQHLAPEAVIDSLPGYAGSRPVRVGNAANTQIQLDVFGPVAELIAEIVATRGSVTEAEAELLAAMARAVERRWKEPDHGIWEIRGAPRHHVHSKVQCWVTVDRAIGVHERCGLPVPPTWPNLRDEIRADVLENGFDESVQSFTAAYDGSDLDAAVLAIGLSGLLPATDERFLSTVHAVETELRDGPTVYRYLADDGLPGREGGFHVCTSWLIEAFVLTGRHADARELFDQFLATVGPTGLMPEQYDPATERSLGNHPQAYSHLGIIRCAALFSGHGVPPVR